MADFYNKSTLTYNSVTTPYNGAPITYTYAGNVPLVLLPKYNLQTIKYYPGRITVAMDPTAGYYHHGIVRNPDTTGFQLLIAPSSTVVIRKYKKIKDAIRVGGCPHCGTYLYNGR